jgi:hypothetical protein
MAAITKDATRVGMDAASGMYAAQISGKLAGEALAKGDAVYIKASDGRVYKAIAAADNEAARCCGLVPDAAAIGEAVSIYGAPSIWDYATGMTPGAPVYLSQAVAGGLDTAQTAVHPQALAQSIDANRIRVVTDYPLW